jgi:hypothetical protein
MICAVVDGSTLKLNAETVNHQPLEAKAITGVIEELERQGNRKPVETHGSARRWQDDR